MNHQDNRNYQYFLHAGSVAICTDPSQEAEARVGVVRKMYFNSSNVLYATLDIGEKIVAAPATTLRVPYYYNNPCIESDLIDCLDTIVLMEAKRDEGCSIVQALTAHINTVHNSEPTPYPRDPMLADEIY